MSEPAVKMDTLKPATEKSAEKGPVDSVNSTNKVIMAFLYSGQHVPVSGIALGWGVSQKLCVA